MSRAAHKTADGFEAARRDIANRAYGTWASAGWGETADVPDHILVERVRAKLGRYVTHPHAVEVQAERGYIRLHGKILTREARRLIRAIERIPGVTGIDNLLEQHDRPGNIPSLQGGRRRPGDRMAVMQRNWSPAARTFAGGVGSAFVAYAYARRDLAGMLFGLAGGALALRAATDLETKRILGVRAGRRAVDIQKTIHINAPVSTVFEFWRHFENFPRFMTNVKDVRSTGPDGQSHWTVAGPAGVPIEFDAVVTKLEPDDTLAWKTVEGAPVAHAGFVHFQPEAGGTRVQVHMSYNPPGGAMGHAVAALLGSDPKREMDQDLARMKTLIETGNPPRDAARPPGTSPAART